VKNLLRNFFLILTSGTEPVSTQWKRAVPQQPDAPGRAQNPAYMAKVVDRFFRADTASMTSTGIHLVFHGLVLTALGQLAVQAEAGLTKGLVVAMGLFGLLVARVSYLREMRTEKAYRRYWESPAASEFKLMRDWFDEAFPASRLVKHSRGILWIFLLLLYAGLTVYALVPSPAHAGPLSCGCPS
jgi:hypothetical protein